MKNLIGKQVIVRAEKAGVFYGTLTAIENKDTVQLKNARKIYFWSGACAIEQIALEGVKNPNQCQFTVVNEEITIMNCIQINPCTKEASTNIESVFVWKK